MTSPRPTQRDIARKAGVGRATVSLALKDNPKISPETRERIKELARELGYTPDPMLSALALYRNERRPKSFQGLIAWLVNVSEGYDWRQSAHYMSYFTGAVERARYHGYQLEEFKLDSGKLSPARAAAILLARNTTGLLLCPQPKPDMEMSFPWERFSAVTIGYSLRQPLMHTVASAHFLNTRHVMRELARRGYRRPGLVIDRALDERCGSNIHAGFLIAQALDPALAPVPPLLEYHGATAEPAARITALAKYVERHQIDAVVTADYSLVETLRAAGFSVPKDIGVAGLSLPSHNTETSGIVEDSEKIGAIAIDALVGMMQRGECGVPSLPIRTHLEGTWLEGATLRPLPARRPAKASQDATTDP